MRTTEKIMWLLIGAAIGAGVALLYAPKTGKETRRFLRKKADRARETLEQTGEDLMDAGKDVYRKGVDAATGAAESAAGLYERGRRLVVRS